MQTSESIKVSVIIPTYNRQDLIVEVLQNIKDSQFSDFELIVVDDGSTDSTASLSSPLCDRVIQHKTNLGVSQARKSGLEAANGEILVFIDSDILIPKDALNKIVDFFDEKKEYDGVTGRLSTTHLNKDFFSQYKNLYMNWIFANQPEDVTFLYGSIFAIRKNALNKLPTSTDVGEDTEYAQQLLESGSKLALLKELQVIHLKSYTCISFFKNNFLVPFHWTRLFLRYKGWTQLSTKKTGFSHASKSQLCSIAISGLILVLFLGFFLEILSPLLLAPAFFIWSILNLRFSYFCAKERGTLFGFMSFLVTFPDNVVMGFGIFIGFLVYLPEHFFCEPAIDEPITKSAGNT